MVCLLCRVFTLVLAVCLPALLSGCAELSAQKAGSLKSQGSALIAVPLDATYEGKRYVGSGKETADFVANAFRRHLSHVEILSGTAYSSSMGPSGASRFDYLVMPTILQWEDRSVGRHDREDYVEIGIRVLRTRDGATISDARLRKPSKVSTAFGSSPVDQLDDQIEEYVSELFRKERTTDR
jgi:hypothetical protein